jgi:hypothetical protein
VKTDYGQGPEWAGRAIEKKYKSDALQTELLDDALTACQIAILYSI